MRKMLFLILAVAFCSISKGQTAPAADTLQDYVGKYKFPDGTPFSEVAVILSNGVLTATSTSGTSELRRREGDIFDIVSYAGLAIFKRNDEKKVVRLQVQVQDLDAEGEKVDGAPSPLYPWQFKNR